MLLNRLKKNHKHLSKWARRQGIEAWRLYDRDIPEYPYIIDIYKEYAVVWLRLEKIDQEESLINNSNLNGSWYEKQSHVHYQV